MTFYRKDLFAQAGLKMPVKPTWTQIEGFAKALHKPAKGQYGICLRGLPGWGENMAVFGTVMNTYGARWFDMNWNPQLNTPAMKKALTFYSGLIKKYGPPGVTSNGFTENLTLFSQGKCGMWIDATVAAGFVTDPAQSKVVNSVGFANSPTGPGTPKGSNWLWIWSLAIPKATTTSRKPSNSSPGRLPKSTSHWSPKKKATGEQCLQEPATRPMPILLTRKLQARLPTSCWTHQACRSHRCHQRQSALHRRAVRGHP